MKRNVLLTITEIFFPCALLLIGYLVRLCFKTETHRFSEEGSLGNFTIDKSNMGLSLEDLSKNMPIVALGLLKYTNTENYNSLLINFAKSSIGEILVNDEEKKMAVVNMLNLTAEEMAYIQSLSGEELSQLISAKLETIPDSTLAQLLNQFTQGEDIGFIYKILQSKSLAELATSPLTETIRSIDTSALQKFDDNQVADMNELLKGTKISIGHWVYVDKAGDSHPSNIPLFNGFSMKPLTTICYDRFYIALIGKDFPDDLETYIQNVLNLTDSSLDSFKNLKYIRFESIKKLNDHVTDKQYGRKESLPAICFGVYFEKASESKFKVSLHYFDNYIMEGIEDVPNNQVDPYEEMQIGPMMEDYLLYANDGYVPMMNLIANYILKTRLPDGNIRLGLTHQKYDKYDYDRFADFNGVYLTFFSALAYLCPLILYILKMVSEKESRSKEAMKIMGLYDRVYFLSYFVQFFIINIFYAFSTALFAYLMFKVIPYFVLVLFYWLYGLCVFAMAYWIQSFIDKIRLSLIIGCLIYCLFLFVAAAVWNGTVAKWKKELAALLPQVNLFLGSMTLGIFKAKFYDFHWKHVNKNFDNYSMETTYLMFTLDFFIYLFLGFYIENVLPKEYGIVRPWYFLFTPSYWCRKQNDSKVDNQLERDEPPPNPHQGEENFQDEDLYKDKTKKGDYFQIKEIVKKFGDGKVAVNKVSFNLFKDEIFALLGHNGAGKTTLISMLTGMYEATHGAAYFEGKNILDDINMDAFRNKLGICPQHDILFPDLTIKEHLEMFCLFKGVPQEKVADEVDKTLKDFRIYDMKDVVAKNLAAGHRRKLSIAIAVIGGSEVIFLDEPSSGMDITSRRNLWEILKKITEKRIIILTTHYMEEASVLGNRIGIMAEGHLKCIGTPLYLIERYGKCMSVNIYKEDHALDKPIIDFFQSSAEGVTYEKLSEEILFKIPKGSLAINIGDFFKKLDANVEELGIKNYSAAMPTLEDVFLNVAVMKKEGDSEDTIRFNANEEENDRIMFLQKYEADYTKSQKFCSDIGILFYKRIKQIYRDKKTFVLEIICPILLTLIGCVVVQVDIFKTSDPIYPNLDIFGEQNIYYAKLNNSDISFQEDLLTTPKDLVNVTERILDYKVPQEAAGMGGVSYISHLHSFIDELYEAQKSQDLKENFASLFFTEEDKAKGQYEMFQFVNARGRQAPAIYTPYFLKKILANHGIEFEYVHYPLPMTEDVKGYGKSLNNFCLVFFVSIAFGLIPANFLCTIVQERVNNTKHLMRIAGVSLFAYWMVNFIFELVKYYATAGVCLLILWAFDFIPNYFWIDYICYGPSMIAFAYLFSYVSDNEALAQNANILFNLVLGSLGSTVVIMLKSLEDTHDAAAYPAYILSVIPCFAFGYCYNILLNGKLMLFLDYGVEYRTVAKSTYLKMKYAGSQFVYMAVVTVVYFVILSIIEANSYTFSPCPSDPLECGAKDENVLAERERANNNEYIPRVLRRKESLLELERQQSKIAEEEGEDALGQKLKKKKEKANPNENAQNINEITQNNLNTDSSLNVKKRAYAVRLKNVRKTFQKGNCCSSTQVQAIKNLSFCLEYGECFGLLGINGAGKTTTFKCITQEHAPEHGSIEIDGKDISSHFDEIRDMFGYCPQFDAIFEFMTVYENLKFYSRIKGVDPNKMDSVINAMLESMMLSNYRDKVAGRLSGGNKRKLSVAISMICNPPIILLDEPSTGMDPEARRFMWAIIHKIATKRAKSSVIMTTHSMDEAETLCRRMAIMVNGEFACLGTSNEIKQKYGYGYEIDVRIKPLPQMDLMNIYNFIGVDKHKKVTLDDYAQILTKVRKANLIKHFAPDKIGRKLFLEVKETDSTSIYSLISWVHYISNALGLISNIYGIFDEIVLTEFIENNFLFKVRKGEGENEKSIGQLFTLLEQHKDDCEISEYSIQQTSLEQIFNDFAADQGKSEEDIQKHEKKFEIPITKELLDDILNNK